MGESAPRSDDDGDADDVGLTDGEAEALRVGLPDGVALEDADGAALDDADGAVDDDGDGAGAAGARRIVAPMRATYAPTVATPVPPALAARATRAS